MLINNATNKRKASDDEPNTKTNEASTSSMTATSNPLVNAAKKVKRESKTGALKRKLANAEEAPGGLFIVRTQIPPSSSLPAASITKPPTKKLKSSQPSQSQPSIFKSSSLSHFRSQSATGTRYNTPDADPALDAAVRAMDSEAADLRRTSRAPQTPDAFGSSTGSNSKHRFPTQTVFKSTSIGHEKHGEVETIIDMSAPLHAEEDDTPQIQRNKRLRAGAMAGITSGGSDTDADTSMAVDPVTPPRKPGQSAPGSSRRKSSVGGRGKRISSSFEATGVITQPHNSVADTSFYKHIDLDLPDSDRVRQLLIWCSARAVAAPSATASSSSTSPPDPPLPKLSAEAEVVLKATQEDIVRKLAERRVDLSLFGRGSDVNPDVILAENKQNVTNRTWEGVYMGHIKSAEKQEEAWKKVSYAYDAYARRVRSNIEKRRADLRIPVPIPGSLTTGTEPSKDTPSAKAQGKQRAPSLGPREQDLPPSFHTGFRLARKILAKSRVRRKVLDPDHDQDQTPGAGPSTLKGVDPDSRPLPTSSQGHDVDVEIEEEVKAAARREEAEADVELEADKVILERIKEVEFKLDHLYVMASQARQTTEVAQMALDARFEVLARALDARHPFLSVDSSSSTTGETPSSVLGRYMKASAGGGRVGGRVEDSRDREEADEALVLLRTLARVDAARPPAQVGDAARRAVREVQRAGDPSERRITEVPMGGTGFGLTPRKMPGTPRRGTTPGR